MGMISDWILYRLSGRYVTDPSIGSSSAMFNLKRRAWSREAAELCGLSAGSPPRGRGVRECHGGGDQTQRHQRPVSQPARPS